MSYNLGPTLHLSGSYNTQRRQFNFEGLTYGAQPGQTYTAMPTSYQGGVAYLLLGNVQAASYAYLAPGNCIVGTGLPSGSKIVQIVDTNTGAGSGTYRMSLPQPQTLGVVTGAYTAVGSYVDYGQVVASAPAFSTGAYAGRLDFYVPTVGLGVSAATPVLTLMNGNVGIGVQSPMAALDVSGTINVTGSKGATTLMSSTSGNIGIGKSNPQYTLDISGNVKVSGIVTTAIPDGSMPLQLATVGYINTVIPYLAATCQRVYGETCKKTTLYFPTACTVKTSDIDVQIDGYLSTGPQVYTFGPAQGQIWTSGAGNTIAYSTNGTTWTNTASSIFTSFGVHAVWNGQIWVATGHGANTLAYSYNGLNWIGLGTTVLASTGYCVAWNGKLWVTCGDSSTNGNTLAYSYDGMNWTGSGQNVITTFVSSVVWNGQMWVAGGSGGNSFAYSYNGINWRGVGSSGLTTGCWYLAWNGQMWIGVGAGTNSIAYSYDGINWTGTSTIFTSYGFVVAWNGKLWVAGGEGTNTLAYSTDGKNWVGIGTTIFSRNCRGLSWNGQMWIATGNGTNAVAYSYNGINWTVSTSLQSGLQSDQVMYQTYVLNRPHTITFPANRIIATGQSANNGNSIAWSIDGSTWTGLGTTVFSTQGKGLSFNGQMWVATGQGQGVSTAGPAGNTLAYSYDGNVWTGLGSIVFSTLGTSVAWSGTMWIATGQSSVSVGNTLATSQDGLTWTGLGTTVFSTAANGTAWNGKLWIAVGQGGNTIAWSQTGKTWTGLGQSVFSTAGTSVVWNGQQFVATGQGGNTIAWSYNGLDWIPATNPLTTAGKYVASNGTMWVSVGQGAGSNAVAYSYDAMNWTNVPGIFTNGTGVLWTGQKWVATGQGGNTLAWSADGVVWTGIASTTSVFSTQGGSIGWTETKPYVYIQHPTIGCGQGTNTLAISNDGIMWKGLGSTIFSTQANVAGWNGQRWLALGQGSGAQGGNTIAISQDGVTWTGLGSSVFSIAGQCIFWDGNKWIAAGQGGNSLAWSTDGLTWTGLGTSVFSTAGYSVMYNGTMWLAGGSGAAGGNTLATSNDGITWTGQGSSPFTTQVNGLAWSGQRWVAVGSGANTLAYSANGTNWTGQSVISIPGLAYYYSFDTNSYSGTAITNLATGVNDATISGNVTTGLITTGNNKVGDAYIAFNFAQSQYVSIANYNVTTNGVTYTGWFKSGTTGWSRVFDFGNGSDNNNILYSPGAGSIAVYNGNVSLQPTIHTGIGDGLWHHFAWTLSYAPGTLTSNWNFYLDNVLIYTTGVGYYPPSINRTTNYIGKSNWLNPYLNGGIDDFRIYNRVLSAAEINMLYMNNTTSIITSSFVGNDVAWNGKIFVAGGTSDVSNGHTMAWSQDGVTWTGLGSTLFSTACTSICWNGTRFVATGQGQGASGGNTLAYSQDGINWYPSVNGNTVFTAAGYGCASNSRIGAVVVDSQVVLNAAGPSKTASMDIVSDTYFQQGFTNMAITMKATPIM